jgi:hypothetical protein
MTAYARPVIAARTFRDAEGSEIRYGSRWGGGSPAEDSYSATSNLDRFAPVHEVADALIEHLGRMYAVAVDEQVEHAQDLMHPTADAARAVRVVPADPAAATLTFVFTSFPGIRLHAGFLQDFAFPSCGCDACDETWESCANDLEAAVFAIVQGGFSEGYDARAELSVWFRLAYPDGSSSGTSRAQDYPAERFDVVADALSRGRTWSAWPSRR